MTRSLVIVILAWPLLSGCVGSIGNGALPAGADVPAGASIMLDVSNPQLRAPLTSALSDLGYVVAPRGSFMLDAAYSERPVNVSFDSDGSLNSANAKLPNLGVCPHRIQRLSLVVTETPTGRPVYQGQAELTQCAGLSSDNATRLARAAVAKIRSTPTLP